MSLRTRGVRNLAILGIGAIAISVATTTIGLTIYRVSGDIYLDRSRPGYLPDQREVDENNGASTTYSYPDSGALDKSELNTYLNEFQKIYQKLKDLSDPYSASSLSDESLGIVPDKLPETPEK